MEQLRYPIGQFIAIKNPTAEQRHSWIEEISAIPQIFRLTVQNLSLEQLLTPYRPNGWTIQQVVHHLADNDMNAFIRFKRALTEDSPVAGSYREELWAELNDYREPIETSLVLLDAIHSRFVVVLQGMQPSDFGRTFRSPTHGVMNLDIATQRYAWHGRHHIAQVASLIERSGW